MATPTDHRPLSACVVILAGGRGQRMGGNKPLCTLQGNSLIGSVIDRLMPQTADIRINAGIVGEALAGHLSQLGLNVLLDQEAYAGLGPMSGVYTALRFADEGNKMDIITVPCDMPRLPPDLVERLAVADMTDLDVVHFKGAHDYPLCAKWHVRQSSHLLNALEASGGRGLGVMKYLGTVRVSTLSVLDDQAFLNVNTPADLAAIEAEEGHERAR